MANQQGKASQEEQKEQRRLGAKKHACGSQILLHDLPLEQKNFLNISVPVRCEVGLAIVLAAVVNIR